MIGESNITKLQKGYNDYLSSLILGDSFTPIFLGGLSKKPETVAALHDAVASFLKYQKGTDKPGWRIDWEPWLSKKLGKQQWPVAVIIETEEDYLFLIKKEKEVALFKQLVQDLLLWNKVIAPWLKARPQKVLELIDSWKGICDVVSYLLHNDVAGYYLRSIPVPVHTKFIQQHKSTIFSLLQHLDNPRFTDAESSLERALGLQEKPSLRTLRWLDASLANLYSSGMTVIGVSPIALKCISWIITEIWIVENETNLYLLPQRKNALALFGKGYALRQLQDIPFMKVASIFYWGDLDEDGFKILHQFRQLYPHVQSVFMDDETVRQHFAEMSQVPFRDKKKELNLLSHEMSAYRILMEKDGRIEQEQLQQKYVLEYLSRIN